MTPLRIAALLAGLVFLAACQKSDLKEPPVPLGDFALGLNIVVADQAQKSPISRDATPEEWKASLEKAMHDRFGRYDEVGTKLYNVGISIDGFALAPPGLPVLLKPRSVLVITANIWDDAAQKKLNVEGKRLIVFENTTGKTFIGSGLTQSKAEQMQILSFNAAEAVEGWLLDNPEWFGLPPKPVRTEPQGTNMSARPDPVAVPPAATAPVATMPVTAPTAVPAVAPPVPAATTGAGAAAAGVAPVAVQPLTTSP